MLLVCCRVGALTLKPSAYASRPWETTEVAVFNHLDGVGSLFFHLRGGRVVKVTSPGWLTDRTRFSYDGYRRQRLVAPLVGGHPVGWPAGVTRWWDYLAGQYRFVFEVDPSTGPYFFWLARLYAAATDGRGRSVGVTLDGGPARAGVYHGAFGLPAAAAADLVLPGCLPHEEEGYLRYPVGGATLFGLAAAAAQLVGRPAARYLPAVYAAATDGRPRRGAAALLQVSPLQRVLAGW